VETSNTYLGLETRDLAKYGSIIVAVLIGASLLISRNASVMVALFMLHATTSFFLRHIKNNRIGIELNLLIAIVAGVVYGPKAGALLGGLAMLFDYVFSLRFSYFCLVTIPTYAAIGFATGILQPESIFFAGMVGAFAYNFVSSGIIVTFLGGHISKCVRFAMTDIAFNMLLFSSVAPAVVSIMG
jgi:hypothetical protein